LPKSEGIGYLMEANGMSVRLIALLQRAVGRIRGGPDVVMVRTSAVLPMDIALPGTSEKRTSIRCNRLTLY
jgi:hypothetical protein